MKYYNYELKNRFILYLFESGVAKRANDIMVGTSELVFSEASLLEQEFGHDLAEFMPSEVTELMAQPGIKKLTKFRPMRFDACLLRYLEWYTHETQRSVTACRGFLLDSLEEYKANTVTSPAHLQAVLDEILESEDAMTVSMVYRAYFWIAFSGILAKKDVCLITAKNLDFDNFKIVFGGYEYPIYQQGVRALQAAANATEFNYIHANYTTVKQRSNGDCILRGFKDDPCANTGWIAAEMRKKRRKERQERQSDAEVIRKLSYRSILHSGIFFRQYEQEAMGGSVDFSHVVKDTAGGEISVKWPERREATNAELKDEYYVWKYLFYKGIV